MTPLESWVFLILTALILAAAFIGAGRAFDWALDRIFRPDSGLPRRWANPDSATDVVALCPCGQDRDYHDRKARGL